MLRKLVGLLGIGARPEYKKRLQAAPLPLTTATSADKKSSGKRQPVPMAHIESSRPTRLDCIPLHKLGLFGPAWRQRLASLGIHTAAEFIDVTSERWQQWGMTEVEIRKLRRWANAVRLASSMPSMKPYEAMMLFAIHRRRLSRLAGERPGRLQRDLLRFALSSRGKKLLRSRQVPDRQRVACWIEAARLATTLPRATH